MREVDASAHGKGMPAPDPGIDVQNLELAVARVPLELHFHKPSESSRCQQALGGLNDLGLVDGLDKSAELAEILGVLSQASCHYGCQGNALFAKGRIRELRFSSSRDHFLDD